MKTQRTKEQYIKDFEAGGPRAIPVTDQEVEWFEELAKDYDFGPLLEELSAENMLKMIKERDDELNIARQN